jgi:DNA-binding response OmpR family regulator
MESNTQNRDTLAEVQHKILVITQKNIDLELITKSLQSIGNCKVYEAGNLKAAFKITSHLDIDLIIVDEKLPSAEGFEIIDKLNSRKLLREIPKILLITSNFKKERYNTYRDINLDFLRKPIDPMMLQARINTLFKNMHKQRAHSIFEEMMTDKIEEAKAFLGIYKSFLDVDENILFIYDRKLNRVVEGNKVFLRFFEDINDVNKVLRSKYIFKKFVPYMEDANYLNHYDFGEWCELSSMSEDFHFALRIEKEATPYSFTLLSKQVEISDHEMYVVKLLNNQNFLPATTEENILDEKKQKQINDELAQIKYELELDEEQRSYPRIRLSLRKISELVNENKKENVLEFKEANLHLVNAYFVLASLLKSYASYKTLYLNEFFVDKNLEENQEEIYVRIDPNALQDTLKGIIDSYFTAPVSYDKRRIKVNIYTHGDELRVEVRASERKESFRNKSVFSKLLKRDELTLPVKDHADILPKNVQQAVEILKADVKHFSVDGDTIFLIKIPLLEKS